ncbi:hypothetical protein YC2023_015469 [Brassica napus]|uniref:Uncharacterized protein n=1 Tax=Brassica oleracea TaxID=3712 RepID=A0A3P6DMI3_BRAOL|nr:unnamed protein product [Brassica oleracea]
MIQVVRMVDEIRREKLASGYKSEVSTVPTPIGREYQDHCIYCEKDYSSFLLCTRPFRKKF